MDANSESCPILYIDRWTGRLGNNMTQLRTVLQTALKYDFNVRFPAHPSFNTQEVRLNTKSDGPIITSPISFFGNCGDVVIPPNSPVFEYDIKRIPQIIRSFLIVKPTMQLGDNELVIHIRSGDIFSNPRPHPGYYQPPLSFYTHILNSNTFNTIYLVAEDQLNPCVNALLNLYPEIKYKKQTIEEDITLILSAKKLIHSNGTFTSSLLFLSEYIQHSYYYHYPDKYKRVMNPWKNTEEQRTCMLTFRE